MANESAEAPNNLRIWEQLCKTDPKHTKRFTRAGGFSGTAVKPIWTILRMTEVFGPCGIGWGMEVPQFDIRAAVDEQLVFCTVCVWYMLDGARGAVYGVGGDKFVISQKNGLRASDEAYKMAYTDALGNAIKFVGVAADIHMGLFDDNKYVKHMDEEFGEQEKQVNAEVARQQAAATTPTTTIPPELDWSYKQATGVLICRVVDVEKRTTKGEKAREYIAVKLNGKAEGKDAAFYWQSTKAAALMSALGKIVKFTVELSKDSKFLNITDVLEIDGVKVELAENMDAEPVEAPNAG